MHWENRNFNHLASPVDSCCPFAVETLPGGNGGRNFLALVLTKDRRWGLADQFLIRNSE